MHLDKFFGDTQAEPGSTELASDRRIGLLELGEQFVDLFSGDANACVRYAQTQTFASKINRDFDPALTSELQRVSHEIHEALGDAPAIAIRQWYAFRNADDKLQPLLGRKRSQRGSNG